MGETKNGTAMEATLGAGNGASLLLRGVKKAFADVKAVDGLDLEVARGECFGLLGPNGAGKTTTIEICEGLTAPDDGTVEVLGLNWRTGAGELRQRIGIQLQETQFPDKLTVEETLRMFRSFFKRGISVDESIATAQLEEKRKGRVGTLSGGQKQRLAMACALVGDPELLFLDEPTTGLDPQARRHLWDLVDELKQAGRTIILTTHYMDEAERLCDRVAIMDHGKVIALGTPKELIALVGGENIVEFAVVESHGSQVSESRPGPQRRGTRGTRIYCGSPSCGCGSVVGDSGGSVASGGCGAAPAIRERVALGGAAHLCRINEPRTAHERVQDALGDAGRCVCEPDRKEFAR